MATLNIMNSRADLITSEIVKDEGEAGVEFALYGEVDGNAGFVLIKDLDSGFMVGVTRHPNFESAEAAHAKNLKWARF